MLKKFLLSGSFSSYLSHLVDVERVVRGLDVGAEGLRRLSVGLPGKLRKNKKQFVCLFVFIYRFKSRVATFTEITGLQTSCSEFAPPDTLLDLRFCGPPFDASLRFGARFSWEMSLGDEHRNRTLPLQLGHISWLSSITTGLRPPANLLLNGARTFANETFSFPNS